MGATLSNGMPRILDMGQCNDSYSAVVVATELAKALDCTVNDLPLSVSESIFHSYFRGIEIDQYLISITPRPLNGSSDDS